ncbi:MAG: hypothetical protein HXX11_13735 [Desulfuromonadales bacterium]|nr:hypothetical protein [Desulfuromonadales bacterium]
MERLAAIPSAHGLLFSRVFIGDSTRVWILAEEEKRASPHTKFLQCKDGKWIYRTMPWGTAGLCGVTVPDIEFFAVGVDGEVLRGTRTGFNDEKVDDSGNGPQKRGFLRDVRMIGGSVYVVGMGRQAYRRGKTGTWSRFDAGILSDTKELVGLNSVDGVNEKNIYAVGLSGEIWFYNGLKWVRVDSPTNLALHRVLCIAPDKVYACGAGGILLSGSEGKFEVIEPDTTDDNFYDMGWFQNKLYVAGLKNLYVMADDKLKVVDFKLGDGFTTGHLHSKENMMWTVGSRHLAYTLDGNKWIQVFYDGE